MTDDSTHAADSAGEPASPFIQRWAASGAAERANDQLFLSELCELIGAAHPEPTRPDVSENACVFERDVTFQNQDGSTSIGRIDHYKRGSFVLEVKQGSEQAEADDSNELKLTSAPKKKTKRGTAIRGTKGWDDAMVKARGQAEQYARALPTDEGWPPFLIVVDVGHSRDQTASHQARRPRGGNIPRHPKTSSRPEKLFADFTRSGKTYLPFPDPGSFRIRLEQLAEEEQREKLRTVWTDPLTLDPSRRSAPVLFEGARGSWQTGWRSRWKARDMRRPASLSF